MTRANWSTTPATNEGSGKALLLKGGWDSVAILGSHEQPNQAQPGTWSPHLQPKRQPDGHSHSPHDPLSRKTSAATTGCAGFTPRLLSQLGGLLTAEAARKVEELRLLFFSLNHNVVVRRRGMPSKDRLFRLTPFGPGLSTGDLSFAGFALRRTLEQARLGASGIDGFR